MKRDIEKDLIEIETAIKVQKEKDNTFTVSVLQRCLELVSELAEYEKTGITPEKIFALAEEYFALGKEVMNYRAIGTVEDLQKIKEALVPCKNEDIPFNGADAAEAFRKGLKAVGTAKGVCMSASDIAEKIKLRASEGVKLSED